MLFFFLSLSLVAAAAAFIRAGCALLSRVICGLDDDDDDDRRRRRPSFPRISLCGLIHGKDNGRRPPRRVGFSDTCRVYHVSPLAEGPRQESMINSPSLS